MHGSQVTTDLAQYWIIVKAKWKVNCEFVANYLHRLGLACASSSCHEWRWRATTSRGRAACAAASPGGPTHSTSPAPRGPARATKQNFTISNVTRRARQTPREAAPKNNAATTNNATDLTWQPAADPFCSLVKKKTVWHKINAECTLSKTEES